MYVPIQSRTNLPGHRRSTAAAVVPASPNADPLRV